MCIRDRIKYKNQTYQVYDHNGKYKIDLDRPAENALDLHPEDDILRKAEQILTLRHKREPNLFIESPDAFRRLLQARMSGLEVEHFGIAMLDNRHRLLELKTLFTGSVSEAAVYPRVVVQECLKINAVAVALVFHNHPSGISTPSVADLSLIHISEPTRPY